MKQLWFLAFSFIFSAVGAQGGDAKKDQASLQGSWSVVSMEESGKKAAAEDIKDFTFNFSGDKLAVKQKDKVLAEFSIKLDPSKKLKTIHFTSLSGDDKGKVDPGIYEMTADTLKMCIHEDGKEPPTAFASTVDSKLTLVHLKRIKK